MHAYFAYWLFGIGYSMILLFTSHSFFFLFFLFCLSIRRTGYNFLKDCYIYAWNSPEQTQALHNSCIQDFLCLQTVLIQCIVKEWFYFDRFNNSVHSIGICLYCFIRITFHNDLNIQITVLCCGVCVFNMLKLCRLWSTGIHEHDHMYNSKYQFLHKVHSS